MKFSISTEILKNITTILTKVVSKDIPSSSFSGIYIEVSSDKVLFKTHQFDFNVMYRVNINESKEGSIFVPIQVLDGAVSSLIDMVVTVELIEKKLIIKTNTSTSEIFILENSEEDGGAITVPDISPSFVMKREVLIQGFRSVQHAAAESIIKPEIASVYIYTKNDSVYFVSTDAFRLAEIRFLLEKKDYNDISILIPNKSVAKILRVLEGVSDTDVSLYVCEDVIYLSTETITIKVNSVKGNFPDYKNIMPTSFDMNITLLRSDALNFLKKARLFSNKLNKISFNVESKTSLLLKLDNETVGSTQNTVPVTINGDIIPIPSFNYRFLNDALSVISDERIILNIINDITKPLMIRGADDTTLTTIISPLIEK